MKISQLMPNKAMAAASGSRLPGGGVDVPGCTGTAVGELEGCAGCVSGSSSSHNSAAIRVMPEQTRSAAL